MNKNRIFEGVEWSDIKNIVVVNDFDDRILRLDYVGYNTLHSNETGKHYWFNNTLVQKVYVGLCMYLSPYDSTYILDRYEVVEVNV